MSLLNRAGRVSNHLDEWLAARPETPGSVCQHLSELLEAVGPDERRLEVVALPPDVSVGWMRVQTSDGTVYAVKVERVR